MGNGDHGFKRLALVAAVVLASASLPALSQEAPTADPAWIDACQTAVDGHFQTIYPKSRKFAWRTARLSPESSRFGHRLQGGGEYRGQGGKRRTLQYDCTYDPYAGQVVKATWESSHHPGERLAVDLTEEMKVTPGDTEEVCTAALDAKIRENWPTYLKMELLDDTLDRRKTREGYLFRGEGRFQGPAGKWHRYRFRCRFDGDEADFEWKRYGKEEDLDLPDDG